MTEPHNTTSSARILIVDDETHMREIISRIVKAEGYSYTTAANGLEALELLAKIDFELLISDISMPEMGGMELLTKAKANSRDLAVLMVTAVDDRQTAMETLDLGVYGYVIKPFLRNELIINIANALRRRELEIGQRHHQHELKKQVAARTEELQLSQQETIYRLAKAAEFRDNETARHTIRVGLFCQILARQAGSDQNTIRLIRDAAPLHDVGKIGISDTILLKPGKLTPEEYRIMQQHPELGYRILAESTSPLLIMGAVIALSHHEKFDGSGYPGGLTGANIPLVGRITAICDVFDAITSKRVYKARGSSQDAISYLKEQRGCHFDPELVDHFLTCLPEIAGVQQQHSDEPSAHDKRCADLDGVAEAKGEQRQGA